MDRRLTVLITGATGRQGGATARALLARGHRVRALTRKADSGSARSLRQAGAEIFAGDFIDPDSLKRAAEGADTAFLMSTPFEMGMAAETDQGIAAVDACAAAGVGHVIYSSVASADNGTGIPHFDSKYAVEQHVAAAGIPFTISAPVAFMDNLVADWAMKSLLDGAVAQALPATRKLQLIASTDIGAFVASLVERRDAVFGRRIEIAGDDVTGDEIAAVLSRATGRPIRYVETPLAELRRQNEDMALMFEWFDRHGYQVDIPGLRREFAEVSWTTLGEWAAARDWDALAWSVPASPRAVRA